MQVLGLDGECILREFPVIRFNQVLRKTQYSVVGSAESEVAFNLMHSYENFVQNRRYDRHAKRQVSQGSNSRPPKSHDHAEQATVTRPRRNLTPKPVRKTTGFRFHTLIPNATTSFSFSFFSLLT